MSRQRRILFSFSLVLLFFSALELILRMNWDPPNWKHTLDVGTQLLPHPTRIWSMEPGAQVQFGVEVKIDENGLRDSNLDGQEKKWLVIGDSSFFGHGLPDEDTLHEQLTQSHLSNGHSIGVQCGGVPGYSILQSNLLMEEVGWGLNPDMLIIGNLWSDNNFEYFVDSQWLNELHSPQAKIIAGLRHFRSFLLLYSYLRPQASLQSKKGNPQSKISWLRSPNAEGKRRVPVEDYAQALDALLSRASEMGVPTLLFQPANRYRVEQSVEEATWDPYFDAMRKVGEYREVPIFDAAAYLRVFGISSNVAFLDELHPTALANSHFVQGLLLQLQSFGWPEKPPIPKSAPPIEQIWSDPWEKGVDFEVNTGQIRR